jgi:hypothetical protein
MVEEAFETDRVVEVVIEICDRDPLISVLPEQYSQLVGRFPVLLGPPSTHRAAAKYRYVPTSTLFINEDEAFSLQAAPGGGRFTFLESIGQPSHYRCPLRLNRILIA